MIYAGLPPASVRYLAALAAHNDRDWFEAHRADYAAHWLGAGLDLVAALSAPCAALSPPLMAVPRLNASLRRINRDVRFSKDKRPYQPRLHLILSTGPDFNKVPGVHLVIDADGIGYGAGFYGFAPEGLEHYRRAMVDPARRQAFEATLAMAAKVGAVLDAPELTRVPKGFAATPWDGLIRRKSVIVRTPNRVAHPDWLFGGEVVPRLMEIFKALAPVAQTLCQFG